MIVEHHHTKSKGQYAETLTKLHLEKLGYIVFITTCEYSPVDLIAMDQQGNLIRIQVKYRQNGRIPYQNCYSDSNGSHTKTIDKTLFDYFALVLDETVIFAPSSYAGETIKFQYPKVNSLFYWWEDFVIGAKPALRALSEFGVILPKTPRPYSARESIRKCNRPTKEELTIMIWNRPVTSVAKDFNVTDQAVRKWCRLYDISTPPRGYWTKKPSWA